MGISNREWNVAVEYLPRKFNTLADKESRKKNRSKGKLNTRIFQNVCYIRGLPEIDLFATRVTTQLQAFFFFREETTLVREEMHFSKVGQI